MGKRDSLRDLPAMTMRVLEIFDSVQGEGREQGLWTRFLRLAGCNLACEWCDTPHSRDPSAGQDMAVADVVRALQGASRVCITGGEPLLQEGALNEVAAQLTMPVVVETNGSLSVARLQAETHWRFAMDAKPPSSGDTWSCYAHELRPQDDLKIVAMGRRDLAFAEQVFASIDEPGPRMYLCATPALARDDLTDFLAKHPRVRAYRQLHKELDLQ